MSTFLQLIVALAVCGTFVGLVAFYGARLAERRRAAAVVPQLAARQIRAIQRRTLRQLLVTAQLADLESADRRGGTSVDVVDVEPESDRR